jgi:hypothetical protein
MYIQSYDWSYAINYREDGHFAVVSTARLRLKLRKAGTTFFLIAQTPNLKKSLRL